MLIVNPIGPGAAVYYQGGPLGRWCGASAAVLGLRGSVDDAALRLVLAGRSPGGAPLAIRPDRHRRAGWDLILAAPKSASLLAALSRDPAAAAVIGAAHRRAVDDTLGWFEAHGCWARRRGALVAADGILAARFEHTSSSASEPHLHTHVLVANLVHVDGSWSSLSGSGLWLHRRGLAATYQLGLRHHLRQGGLALSWRRRDDGLMDIAGVPDAAIRASSSRRAGIVAAGGRDDRRLGTDVAIQHRLRTSPVDPWEARAAAAGFDAERARGLLEAAGRRAVEQRSARHRGDQGPPAGPDDQALVGAVISQLTRRRSTFSVTDVLGALAAVHSDGAAAADAHRWAEALCQSCPQAPGGRWTSPHAQHLDRRLWAEARARAGGGGAVPARVVESAIAARPHLGPEAADAVRRLTSGAPGVHVLGARGHDGRRDPDAFVAQASVLAAAAQAWRDTGLAVELHTSSPAAARRWHALTGLIGRGHLGARGAMPLDRAAVVVVDRADRASTAALHALLEAAGRQAVVVLVEGGTMPGRDRALSEGLELVGAEIGRLRVDGPVLGLGGTGQRRGLDPIGHLVDEWIRAGSGHDRPVLVGLGPAECVALNDLARRHLRAEGAFGVGEVMVGSRCYAPGDRVVALRRGHVPAGTIGWVDSVEASERRAGLRVRWDGMGVADLDRAAALRIGHAYATTPAMLRLRDGAVMVLGAAADIGRHAGRAVAAVSLARSGRALEWGGRQDLEPSGPGRGGGTDREPPDGLAPRVEPAAPRRQGPRAPSVGLGL